MAKQDTLQRIKERYADAADFMREQHSRMREDARFSNPACPEQWDSGAVSARKGRPMLVFDKTNQFISQVVNDMRQNKPQIQVLPADSRADVAVAQKLNGIIKHIEYVSRAGIAYDTAGEHQVRLGLGYIRVIPHVMRPETNEQEIRILRVHDPLSVLLDPNSTEPDGSDAMFGFVETLMTRRAFNAAYPKAKGQSFESDGGRWFGDDFVLVCEYFEIKEETENRIAVGVDGQQTLTEDEYWQAVRQTGVQLPVVGTFESKKRKVIWQKVTGADVLEETDFPSQYLPLIPVMGHEMWVDGKRYLCGMVRRMMDSQRFHNYAISAAAEAIAMQPKAPYLAPAEAIEGWEDEWNQLNTGNKAYLPYNSVADGGEAIAAPTRPAPPVLSPGWADLIQYSATSMEASVGMYAANLGKQSNETSGRAIRARQMEGDTANFHFSDNLSRSIEQLGRVVVDMIPRMFDTPRQARIVGEDGSQDFVQVDPSMPMAAKKKGRKVITINPNVGAYDVRVKTGPSYTSLRQESAEQMGNLIQAKPELMQIIGDEWIKAMDWPGAEKVAQRLKAMLPPQLQAIEDEDSELEPQAIQIIEGMKQQIQQLSQALEAAAAEAESKEIDRQKMEADILTNGYKAVTERLAALAGASQSKTSMGPDGEPQQQQPTLPPGLDVLIRQTIMEAMRLPPTSPPEMQPTEPPQGGFFTPEVPQ